MTEDKILKCAQANPPFALKTAAAHGDLASREGYRMVLMCNHDKSKTGRKAQAKLRS